MKNRICSMLIILFAVLTLYGCTEQTKAPEAFEPEPLVLEYPEPCQEGTLTVYLNDMEDFCYYGQIEIINDGKDGSDILIFVHADKKTMGDDWF